MEGKDCLVCVCAAAAAQASHRQRHRDDRVPRGRLAAVHAQIRPLALPARLHHRARAQRQHRPHNVQVRTHWARHNATYMCVVNLANAANTMLECYIVKTVLIVGVVNNAC